MPLVSFDLESVSGIYSTGRGKTADPKGAVRSPSRRLASVAAGGPGKECPQASENWHFCDGQHSGGVGPSLAS